MAATVGGIKPAGIKCRTLSADTNDEKMHTVNYSTTALLFYDRLLWAGVFKINYMLVSELIAKLQQYPRELEVRVVNVAIEDDENCPTFEVEAISSAKENNEDHEDPRDKDFVLIEMLDNSYIQEEYDITKE